MLEHLRILNAIINLVVGAWIGFFIYQKSKSYKYDFLKSLIHLIIFYNLCILIMLVSKYFALNLIKNISPGDVILLGNLAILAVTLSGYGMIISVLRIASGLRDEKPSTLYKIWIVVGIILIVFYCAVKIAFPQKSISFTWLNVILGFAVANILILDIRIPIGMVRYGKKNPGKDKAKISKAFGYLYLSRYGVTFTIFITLGLIFWWKLPEAPQPFIAFLILLYFNLVPYIWFRYFFLEYADSMLKLVEDKSALDPIFEKYNISKREQEILKLILDGKSNKEMEDSLFISYHTVKNHVYNLYQKLGVTNRHELVHFIMKFERAQK